MTLKQIAVVGLKQLVRMILTGPGALEATSLLILSNRLHLGITLTTHLKVRGMHSVSVPTDFPQLTVV